MKILITGSSGFVGRNLFSSLEKDFEVIGLSRSKSETTNFIGNICDEENIQNSLNHIKPDLIIHSAALTNVDYCEENKEEAWNVNVKGTLNLVKWAVVNRKKIIYISTDYVYPGKINNYDENSEVEPVNFYGKTKLAGEKIVSILSDYLILRPTVIFGYDKNGKNFLMQLLGLKDKKKIVYDQISNPTDVKVLCDYIKISINKNISGIFVATGPETLDRLSFSFLVAEIFGLNKELFIKTDTSSLGQKAIRPLNNGTNSLKIRNLLDYKCPSLRESLENIKKDYFN